MQPPRLVAVHVHPERSSTALEIDLTHSVPFRIATHANPDSIEIDLPGVEWPASVPGSGTGGGYVAVYRRAPLPEGGVRLVVETTTSVKVSEAGMGLAAPGQPAAFTLELRSEDGSSPPMDAPFATRGPASIADLVEPPPVRPAPEQQPARHVAPATTSVPAAAPASIIPAAIAAPTPVAALIARHIDSPHAATRRVIAIDPGHGGLDPGTASAEGVFEKAITLETGLSLKSALESTGRYAVVMTRGSDIFIPLQDRVKIARAAGAELFISLHCDAMESREAHGATVYTLSQNASDAVSERLAAQENRSAAIGGMNLAREDEGTANLLIDLSMRDSMNQSNRFAELLVGEFGEHRIRLQELKPHRSAGFAVLKAADMPSVLIEMGYLSDSGDAALLANPGHQKAISSAIVAGVDRYFRVPESARRS